MYGSVWPDTARHGRNSKQEGKTTMAKVTQPIEGTNFYEEYKLKALGEGLTPLMMANPSSMDKRIIEEIIRIKQIPKPEAEAEAAAYRCPDGTLGIPARCVRACILGAAPNLKIGGRAASRVLKESIGFFPPLEGDELFPLEDLDKKPISNYEIDIRRAVIQGSGIMRARPKIMPWRFRPTLKLTVTAGTDIEGFRRGLFQVFNRAGTFPGILDGRPEGKKGYGLWFGKFRILELEIEPLNN